MVVTVNMYDCMTSGKFKITMTITTVNGTGTGESDLVIFTVDGIPVGESIELICNLQSACCSFV